MDFLGNTRVFWTEHTLVTAQFMREYDRFGNPLTAPIELTSLSGSLVATFAGLPDGSFDEVYLDGDFYVLRFDATGKFLAGPIFVGANPFPGASSLHPTIKAAADASGDLLIVFSAGLFQPEYQSHVYSARVSAAGAVKGPSLLSTNVGGIQESPAVAVGADGAGVIAWSDYRQNAIIARTVTGAGVAMGSEFTVYHDSRTSAGQVSAAIDAAGEVTLAYEGLDGIHASRYRGDGTSDGGDFKVYSSLGDNQYSPLVASSQGWTVIAWNDGNAGPAGAEVDAQLYDPQGRPKGTPFLVPNVLAPTELTGLAFGNDGKVSVEFNQVSLNDLLHTVTDFRLYRVDLEPAFQGEYHFSASFGSAVGTVVGAVKAVDPDGDQIDYRILGKSPFAVRPAYGANHGRRRHCSEIDGHYELSTDDSSR